jgi:predicted permease
MKLGEAWRIAKIAATESMLKGNIQMSGGFASHSAQQNPEKFVRGARRGLTGNKIAYSFFYGIAAVFFPLAFIAFQSGFLLVFAGMSLFFLLSLVMLVSFNLIYMTSFASGEALTQLSALPFSRDDLSLISFLTFFRMLDLPLVVYVSAFTIVYGLITGSILGTAIVLSFSVANAVIGIFLSFFLARAFYTRILSMGGSRPRNILRTVMVIIYGFVTFGMFYLFSYILQLAPTLASFFTFAQDPRYIWTSLVYPFSFTYLIATVTTSTSILPSLMSTRSILAIAASAFYIIIAYFAFKRGRRALRQLALGEIQMAPRLAGTTSEVRIKVGRIFPSIFKKDLKLASRNPAYAMFLVFPVLSILLFTLFVGKYDTIRVRDVMTALLTSSFFSSFFSVTLMWSESRGVSVLAQLPISTRRVVQAKSLASTVVSFAIPATLLVVSFFKPLTTPYSILIAVAEIGGIYSGALIATTLLCALFGEGRLPSAGLERHMLKYGFTMIVSGIFILLPMAVMGIVYLLFTQNYQIITMTMGGAALIEVAAVNLISRAALRD